MNAAEMMAQNLSEMNRMMQDERARIGPQPPESTADLVDPLLKHHLSMWLARCGGQSSSDTPQEQEAPQSHFVSGMSHAPVEEVLACPPQKAPSLALQAEMELAYHRREAAKLEEAACFLRENPAFDKFIRLVRAGVISLS